MFGLPSLPAMLAMLTMRPQPRSRMPGTNAWHVLKVPCTLTAKVCIQPSSGTSHSGTLGPTTPAEFTRMSTGPIRSAAARTAAASETSTRTSAPSARSSVTTVTPSAASRAAVAAPIPLRPPVTTAVREAFMGQMISALDLQVEAFDATDHMDEAGEVDGLEQEAARRYAPRAQDRLVDGRRGAHGHRQVVQNRVGADHVEEGQPV